MPLTTLTFPNDINVSVQVGDIIYYAAADTIDIVSSVGVTTTAKVRVFAVVADCDGHGDNEAQNVTFAS